MRIFLPHTSCLALARRDYMGSKLDGGGLGGGRSVAEFNPTSSHNRKHNYRVTRPYRLACNMQRQSISWTHGLKTFTVYRHTYTRQTVQSTTIAKGWFHRSALSMRSTEVAVSQLSPTLSRDGPISGEKKSFSSSSSSSGVAALPFH